MAQLPPDNVQYRQGLVTLVRAERALEPAILDVIDDWLEATRFVILHELAQRRGLTAAGDHADAVDAATAAYDTWRKGVNNRLIPAIGIAFGQAYRDIRHGHPPQRYETEYLETVSDRLRIWPEGAMEEVRAELVDALQSGEDYKQMGDKIGAVLGIDGHTRELRADITYVENRLQHDNTLTPGERKELAAERRRLWREHDESLGQWQWKARRIARTEAHAATEWAKLKAATDVAYETGQPIFKRWRATRDERVRPSHRVADGQVVKIMNAFRVGGFMLRFPGDPAAMAPQESINCRCTSAIWSGDMLQDGLQGPDGSIGEVKPGGVRLGPDDPDAADKAIEEAADDLGQPSPPKVRGEDHGQPAPGPIEPVPLTEDRSTPRLDLSGVDDDELVELLAKAHDARDDDLYEWVDAEWERRNGTGEPEPEWTSDDQEVSDWLTAEDTWRLDVVEWLATEKQWNLDVQEWLDAEQTWPADPLPVLPKIDDGRDLSSPRGALLRANNNVAEVNRNYETGRDEWRINCQRAVQALELRDRGYDVVATPRINPNPNIDPTSWSTQVLDSPPFKWPLNEDERGRLLRLLYPKSHGFTERMLSRIRLTSFAEMWREKDGSMRHFRPTTKTQLPKELAKMPVGARGWVGIRWKDGDGHVFSWQVIADPFTGEPAVRFVDPQSTDYDASRYLSMAKQGGLTWMRVDDLVPNSEVLDMVRGVE